MRTYKHSELDWKRFDELGRRLVGKKYVFGAEVNLLDGNPDNIKEIDCSELIEWMFRRHGITVPDGSYNQAKVSTKIIGQILVGDLAFKADPETGAIHHVGVCLNDKEILEAKGKNYGVVVTPIQKFMASSHFSHFARLNCITTEEAVC